MDLGPPPHRLAGGGDLPDPAWPSTEWPAGPIGPPPEPFRSQEEDEEAERRSPRRTLVVSLLACVLLGTGVTLGVRAVLGLLDGTVVRAPRATRAAAPTATAPPGLPVGAPASVSRVAETAFPSIVAVTSLIGGLPCGGSGVGYSEDGHLLTNHRVSENAADLRVIYS